VNDDDLCYLSAVEAMIAFRTRALSPVEVMTAVIARAERVEPTVNAFAVRRFGEALAAAKAAEACFGPGGRDPRPLEGLPVAVKMDVAIAGDPASAGCSALEHVLATHTDAMPQRIMAAGAIVHARSTMPEFASASFTHSRLWGISRNPWNPRYSPGGSSGGSAAALAAGTAVLATGSDNAGSIRMPASYCGVVGYKPPYGRVPCPPPLNRDPYMSLGPIARTVADCALFLEVMSGPDLSDPSSLPALVAVRPPFTGVGALRVAVSPDLGGFPVEPLIQEATVRAAEALADAGADVSQVDIGWDWHDVLATGRAHLEHIVGAMASRAAAHFSNEMMPYSTAFVDSIGPIGRDGVLLTLEGEQRVWERLRLVFEHFDVLMCPTQGLFGFEAGEDYVANGPVIDGAEARYPFETHMGLPFNITNTCPVLSVPMAVAPNRIPMGVQIVGRPYDERSVFRAGAALEEVVSVGGPFSTPSNRPIL
jgi:Asp-tRNA(Asn)/Glu-tRNA(Gln) amidotransferase A subunit family amidase